MTIHFFNFAEKWVKMISRCLCFCWTGHNFQSLSQWLIERHSYINQKLDNNLKNIMIIDVLSLWFLLHFSNIVIVVFFLISYFYFFCRQNSSEMAREIFLILTGMVENINNSRLFSTFSKFISDGPFPVSWQKLPQRNIKCGRDLNN